MWNKLVCWLVLGLHSYNGNSNAVLMCSFSLQGTPFGKGTINGWAIALHS